VKTIKNVRRLGMEKTELVKLLLPLLVLQGALVVYSLVDMYRNGVRNLSKLIWSLIIIFINALGPILYLTLGRGEGVNADD
jgi:hypothetical protein